jgi:hypothetical protein
MARRCASRAQEAKIENFRELGLGDHPAGMTLRDKAIEIAENAHYTYCHLELVP